MSAWILPSNASLRGKNSFEFSKQPKKCEEVKIVIFCCLLCTTLTGPKCFYSNYLPRCGVIDAGAKNYYNNLKVFTCVGTTPTPPPYHSGTLVYPCWASNFYCEKLNWRIKLLLGVYFAGFKVSPNSSSAPRLRGPSEIKNFAIPKKIAIRKYYLTRLAMRRKTNFKL